MNNITMQAANFSYQYARAAATVDTLAEKIVVRGIGIAVVVGLLVGIIYYIYDTFFC